MTISLLKKILIFIMVLVVVFALSASFTSAKYTHQEEYVFTVVTTVSGYSYVFTPAEASEAKSIGVTLTAYMTGANRINIYNVSGSTIATLSITINYTNTSKNKQDTATLSIYNSSGSLISPTASFIFRKKKTNTNITPIPSWSSLSLANKSFVYATMNVSTNNTRGTITINTITVAVTYA